MSRQGYIETTDIPEGATHYMPESGHSHFSWVCFKDKDKPAQMYIICPENDILSWVKFTPDEDEYGKMELYKIPDVHYVNIKLKVDDMKDIKDFILFLFHTGIDVVFVLAVIPLLVLLFMEILGFSYG